MKEKTVVLYHAYGIKELYLQVAFSVLTLFDKLIKDKSDIECVIYTDNIQEFKKLLPGFPIIYESLTSGKIKEYRGELDFVHRLKIFIIKDCLEKYKCKVLYLDADTFLVKSPLSLLKKISPDHVIMNYDGYDLIEAGESEETNWLLMRKILKEKVFEWNGKAFKIPLSTRMWNAGIIGVDSTHLAYFEEVISISDQIYAHAPVFTAEQFAFSYVFQTNFSMSSTEDVVVHYWPRHLKKLYNYHYKKFFKVNSGLSGEDLIIQASLLAEERETLSLPKATILDRLLLRLKLISEVAINGKVSSHY